MRSVLDAKVTKALATRRGPDFVVDVDLTFDIGMTMIIGRSGAGKSTLLACIAGVTNPDLGLVKIGDRTLTCTQSGIALPMHRRRVGFLFQDLALFPHLSVRENVAYGIHGDTATRKERTERVMDSFGISNLWNRRPHEISGGEQQRVALARTLITEPTALLLDEPMSSLDPDTKSAIIDDLRLWNSERRLPVVYVTHDDSEVLAMGIRTVTMSQGRVVNDAPSTNARAHSSHNVSQVSALVVSFDPVTMVAQCRLMNSDIVIAAHRPGSTPGDIVTVALNPEVSSYDRRISHSS